jgi:hypothetical protein
MVRYFGRVAEAAVKRRFATKADAWQAMGWIVPLATVLGIPAGYVQTTRCCVPLLTRRTVQAL